MLLVGTYHGRGGQFSSIQGAVDAARPGDWILIAPGDYHEQGDRVRGHHPPGKQPGEVVAGGAVWITKPRLHLRGLDRNAVVVDGTMPGASKCSSAKADQDLGPLDKGGQPEGRNGIEVYRADGVSIENLTACNFLTGADLGGEQIWFNGGDGSGKIGMGSLRGTYLTATDSFYRPNPSVEADYGIFVSNANGPGLIEHAYASNMNDADFYVGACADCNIRLEDVHAQNSAQGYSGTNSGGHVIVENSQFDNNRSGFSINSQNNDDAPSPQDGACPHGGVGPLGTHSCWIFRNNYVHDNNNPNAPALGTNAAGPLGSGLVIAGGRHVTVIANRFVNNGSWGILLVPFRDAGHPPSIAHCRGGIASRPVGRAPVCFFDDFGNDIANNTLSHNGFFGNPSNGDLGEISNPELEGNCWKGNRHPVAGDVSSDPPNLQTTHSQCGVPNTGVSVASPLGLQVTCATHLLMPCPSPAGAKAGDVILSPPGVQAACDTQLLAPCPATAVFHRPRPTGVHPIPLAPQPTMANPCQDVPANPWCDRASRG